MLKSPMKKKFLKKLIGFSALLVAMCLSNHLMAQGPPPPPPSVPLDGGAGVLLAVGVAYGVRKLYSSKFGDRS